MEMDQPLGELSVPVPASSSQTEGISKSWPGVVTGESLYVCLCRMSSRFCQSVCLSVCLTFDVCLFVYLTMQEVMSAFSAMRLKVLASSLCPQQLISLRHLH